MIFSKRTGQIVGVITGVRYLRNNDGACSANTVTHAKTVSSAWTGSFWLDAGGNDVPYFDVVCPD